jgi:hypothetical protein
MLEKEEKKLTRNIVLVGSKKRRMAFGSTVEGIGKVEQQENGQTFLTFIE